MTTFQEQVKKIEAKNAPLIFSEGNKVEDQAPQKTKAERAKGLVFRRRMWQIYNHLEKVKDLAYQDRDQAKKARHWDETQDLTQAIYHLARAMAHFRHVAKRRYGIDIEDLASYK